MQLPIFHIALQPKQGMGLLDIMVGTLQSIIANQNKGSSYLTYKGYMCGYMRAYKAVIVPPIL